MILITGGLGFIGSHTCVELIESGHDIVILDNLYNCDKSVLSALEKIVGRTIPFVEVDLCDKEALGQVFSAYSIDAVMHFAGYKAVGESVEKPLMYYSNNICGTINLLEQMQKHGSNIIIFSSSATVYREDNESPFKENAPLGCTNPYGWTKLMIEQILQDVSASNPNFTGAILRYFNPVGAHASGLIGENPKGQPNNLMPNIANVALGKVDQLKIFGDDYPTYDGTGVRDYIHVVDLARGHVAALQYATEHTGMLAVNLGTGEGCSVLGLICEYENASGKKIPYSIVERRPGDVAICFADATLAYDLLGWKATHTIQDMCESSWNYASNYKET
ncbi:UDP-glucose 4-epimerase GalE [Eubacteriales bacterium OttesenSCG-928-M02]|nr:UDP-glucose 4-epimerase GalE [Eubacteriales bacterium OttesenSCG-928-M02]